MTSRDIVTTRNQRPRLSSPADLKPLRRAEQLEDLFLYWVPVTSYPIPEGERAWLNELLDRLSSYLVEQHKLRAEVFLEYKTVYPDLLDRFLDLAFDLTPIMGFGYKPGVPLPPFPTMEDLQPFIDGKKKFNFGDYVGDYIYWFLAKEEKLQRKNFLGYGGMAILFLPPDPAAIPAKLPISPKLKEHPMFKELFTRFDMDKVNARAHALSDKWLKTSMELYAKDLPKSPQMKGVQFVVPLLKSADFFAQPENCKSLKGLCDFYVRESVPDCGVLLAAAKDQDAALAGILKDMQNDGLRYPLR